MFWILRKFDWNYIASETAIVTIGVAMALAVDAWWQDRVDHTTESGYLQGLREDFTITASDLSQEVASSAESMAAIDELVELMNAGNANDRSEVLDLISRSFDTSVLRPVTTTYDDLVTSGNLGLLRNDDLRSALAGWSAQLAIHRRFEDHILFPHYLATDDFLMHNTRVPEELGNGLLNDTRYEADTSTLLSDQTFRNLLLIRRGWIEARSTSLEELQERLIQVRRLLGAESP